MNHAERLAGAVLDNLQYQQDWTELRILTHSPIDSELLMRPMVFGLPPRRLYVHPDDQIAIVKANAVPDGKMLDTPEAEWVLPTHILEKWTVKAFAAVFDVLPVQSSSHPERPKRIVLATIHDDSTIVYYLMHDGIVKPRQN
ncbi:tRNA-splicing endonuclease subunit Sen15 [Xylaria nigripes]|nr:tRNA-splicing endonuclease subunit Sen15 [Xylaria nigripes]